MAGSHSHAGHHHHSAAGVSASRLTLSIALTLGFVLIEAVAGLRAHSLALLSDAGHNFSDAFALVLSWYALWVANKPATPTHTYGYHRVGILTALFNAVTLLGIAFFIIRDALLLFMHPHASSGGTMVVVATLALALNAFIALGLRGEAAHSVNMRSAFLHMAGDAVASLGVIVAGLTVQYMHWLYADPVISLLIGGYILYSSWGIVSETINVLLESTPREVDVRVMVGDLLAVRGVVDIHDLHVWTIADGMTALSCHLRVAEPDAGRAGAVVGEVKAMLQGRYGVRHSTIETECGGCHASDLHCRLETSHHSHCEH